MNEPSEQWEQTVREYARHFPYPPTPNLAGRVRPLRRTLFHKPLVRFAFALLLVALLFSILSLPAVQAGLADFFQIGSVRIWRTPFKPTLTIPPASPMIGETVTMEEAQAEVWYPVRLPTYPQGLGEPDEVYILNREEDGIHFIWKATATHPELRLTQFGDGFWIDKWGPTLEIRTPSTQVNGRYAAWLPGPHVWSFRGNDSDRDVVVPEGFNVLIWVERNVTYRLESPLAQEEAVKVAESLP